MAAALRFAARRIFGHALERLPPQVVLTAAKDLAPKTSHGGTWIRLPFSSSSQSPATLLTDNKAARRSSAVYKDLFKAATGSALAGLVAGSMALSPLYVSIIRLGAQRRAAEKEHRDWLKLNERYT